MSDFKLYLEEITEMAAENDSQYAHHLADQLNKEYEHLLERLRTAEFDRFYGTK